MNRTVALLLLAAMACSGHGPAGGPCQETMPGMTMCPAPAALTPVDSTRPHHPRRVWPVVREALPLVLSAATLGVVLSYRSTHTLTCQTVTNLQPGSSTVAQTCTWQTQIRP